MDRDQLRATVLGFVVVAVILGALIALNDVDRVVGEILAADPAVLLLVVGATLGWLTAWGIALRTVLGTLGVSVSVPTSFALFNGAMFANNVTPLGQAGGEPITAALISTITGTDYERGLAAIASVDTLNFFPSVTLALVGVGYYATLTTFTRQLRIASAAVVGLAVLVPVAGYVAWQNRRRVQEVLVTRFVPFFRWIARLVPGVSPPEKNEVAGKIASFFADVEQLSRDRRAITVTLASSAAGWAMQMCALWLAFRAIGTTVDPVILLFAVSMGAIAGAAPTPGGLGLIEAVLVTVLVVLLPVAGSTVTAAVIVFRGSVYWVPVLVGSVVTTYVGVNVFDNDLA